METPSLTTITLLCSLTVLLSSLGVQMISGFVQVKQNLQEVMEFYIFTFL